MEFVAQTMRSFRYDLFSKVPIPIYTFARRVALLILTFLSFGRGRRVKVADIYPLYVEWERSAIDFKTWEAEFIKEFGKALQSPQVVFDIGASIGEWSALAATLVGSENVHVFEPNLPSWWHIQKVFTLNRLSPPAGIFPGFAANADSASEQPLASASSRKWLSKVIGAAGFESLDQPKGIPSIRLDTYCNRLGVFPDVIKIDVEGAEGEVLRGSQNLLKTHAPKIFLSLHPWVLPDFGDSKEALLAWLAEQGYTCTLLSVDHEEHWLCSPRF